MVWYEAPITLVKVHEDDSLPLSKMPGMVDSDGQVVARAMPGCIVPAYAKTTCLVGVPAACKVAGWTPLDLDAAVAFFTAVYGRDPGPREVF